MSIIRNSIEVAGIMAENDLPEEINNGHYVQYSETETFFIPRYKSPIKNIFQAVINIETNSNRVMKTPVGKTVVIDGTKHIKIIYSEKGHSSKANIVNIEVPFNTFTEVDKDKEIEKVNVYVLDAYFSLVENRKLYSHMVYMVEFIYSDILETDDEDFDLQIDEEDKIDNMDFIEDIDGNSDIEETEEVEYIGDTEYTDDPEVDDKGFLKYGDEANVLENMIMGEERKDFRVDEIEYMKEVEFDINEIVDFEIESSEEEGLEEAFAEPVEDPLVEDISNIVSEKNKKKIKKLHENELAQDGEEEDNYSEIDSEYL